MWLERLVQLKKNSGMTIEQIATASGVPKGTLNKLFAGQTKDPQLSTVSAVVHCMGYTLDDLSGDTSNGETVLTPRQSALLSSFDQLNEEGQTKAVEYVEDLVLTGRYKKCSAPDLGAKEGNKNPFQHQPERFICMGENYVKLLSRPWCQVLGRPLF